MAPIALFLAIAIALAPQDAHAETSVANKANDVDPWIFDPSQWSNFHAANPNADDDGSEAPKPVGDVDPSIYDPSQWSNFHAANPNADGVASDTPTMSTAAPSPAQ